MSIIRTTTLINAPKTRIFDLARSIDAHMASTSQSNERAVEGCTSGLIKLGQTVTWEAKHLGIKQRLTVRISAFDRPNSFADEMVSGAFKEMHHVHQFHALSESQTEMTDELHLRAPLGLLGRIAEVLFLNAYMKRFLLARNRVLKELAESDLWKEFLPNDSIERKPRV